MYYCDICITGADIAFVLDSSGSAGQGNWPKVLNFVKKFVRELAIGPLDNKVAVISYGNRATMHFTLDDHLTKEDLNGAIDRIPFQNKMTNTSGM